MIDFPLIKVSLAAPDSDLHIKRQTEEESHPYRLEFMRDRDRILYSKSFRRLSGKTQVFLTSFDDHTRTRLTHTLEVSQIARTIASRLKLNGDLTEAISLGHDLGHTPFGHIGERTLNYIMNGCEHFSDQILENQRGFKHNLQSVRVVSELEERSFKDVGLNLTNFTLFGLCFHSTLDWAYKANGLIKICDYCSNADVSRCNFGVKSKECGNSGSLNVSFYPDRIINLMKQNLNDNLAWSFEALVVAISDEIAQRHHDLEDGIEARLMSRDEILDLLEGFKPFFENNHLDKSNFKQVTDEKNIPRFISLLSRFIVNFLVNQLIKNSLTNMQKVVDDYGIDCDAAFSLLYKQIDFNDVRNTIQFSPDFQKIHSKFEKELADRVLNSFEVQRMDGKGRYIIRRLFKAYLTNPQQLHDKTIISLYKMYDNGRCLNLDFNDSSKFTQNIGKLRSQLQEDRFRLSSDPKFKTALLRVICDYIAGMTDNYAIQEYHKLYG